MAASTSEVERGGRLVEDEDRRVLQDHPRNRDALALAARQLDAALAHMRVVAAPPAMVLEVHDEVVGVGEAGRLLDLGVGRTGLTVGDVLPDRPVQERRVLRHDGDVPSAGCPASRPRCPARR